MSLNGEESVEDADKHMAEDDPLQNAQEHPGGEDLRGGTPFRENNTEENPKRKLADISTELVIEAALKEFEALHSESETMTE